ncbi:CocE/NonD family hydrolase [Flavihumibacter stibioxidans]|uniref:X-Pro dipeptidyl-peptidase n=1 Tax=Flavihumibacter stibioxidans TaxID=1834163 RepID=A0ABR7MDU8_9BACT|nr:CocE/NonD family hydrolase [Flavihumibacter stibioxidans]MBC6493136.1 X-Pro dipeptidyl-peptidase [Flavihumibacter stibioxidans]
MRKLVILLTAVFGTLITTAQTINTQDSAWIRDNYVKMERYIPMRDGVKLFTSIYMPKDASEKHPILMSRTPYSCAPYGEQNWRAFWETHWKYYMREGYIIVLQDVRGRWMSEGVFEDVRPFNHNKKSNTDIDESSDTYDAIEWLTKNLPNNNNNVGVFGISYPGFYSTMAAASGHPALKAVSPQAPVTDWFIGDDFHHNGALAIMDGFDFYAGGFGYPRPAPTTRGPVNKLNLPRNDNYKTMLDIGALPNFMKLTGDTIKFWKDLYAHPNYDDFWKARDARRAMYNIKPVMLTVGGLFDAEDTYGAWNLYKAIEKQSKSTNNRIVMGPWFHGQWSRGDGSYLGNVRFGSRTSEWYQNNIEIPFFNYFLKGKGEEPKLAEATVFFSGENAWKEFSAWPPEAMKLQPIYLSENGGLSWNRPATKSQPSEYISDPAKPVPYTEDVHYSRTREYMTDDQRFASRRPDVLTFETAPLQEDLTLAGPVIADLMVSISSTDADFVVKVIDVFPDDFAYSDAIPQPARTAGGSYPMGSYQMLVRGEIMRGKFRKSFEQPVPFKPNLPENVKFELPDIAHTFKKGHRLMIQIQSSWFPLMDRNPQKFMNIYEAKDSDFQKATIRILHDNKFASSILLPVLK